jgi:uncharacterized protein (TIGR02145 family)
MNKARKLFLTAAMVLVTAISAQAQSVGINSTGNPPNSSAMLDVSATNKGLLIPNVALSGTNDAATISTPAVSLLVYNTSGANGVTPGYYYNSGSTGLPVWTRLLIANANLTGMVTSSGNVTTVVTNADLTGEVTSVGNAATVANSAVIAKVLTGYTSGAGTVAATDNILQAFQILNGNIKSLEDNVVADPDYRILDVEGNRYKVVKIGTQTWMAENLKTTKYNDGASITIVTDNGAWIALGTDAYCWYNNDAATYKATYGAMYNWYAVNTAKLCPIGWHVPTDAEWTTLTDYLGGADVAGGKLKEAGNSHWTSTNVGATNSSSFTALPGGFRHEVDGTFMNVGLYGYWWSRTAVDESNAWCFYLYKDNASSWVGYNGVKRYGFPVRCVRD